MEFVNVKAQPCNSQGLTSKQQLPVEFRISEDLIAAYQGDIVHLKGGDVLNLGGHFYRDFRINKKPVRTITRTN